MYTIHANGQLLFDSLSENVESIVLSPKVLLDINKAGSLSFVVPPGNKLHGKMNKLKTLVTVEQDGTQLARCRVMETEGDFYNQQSVYCEGEKAFLLDSVHAPYSYSGTAHGLFRKLIENHNVMVDAEKQFTVGEITAVSSSETTAVEVEIYANTSSEIEDRLLSVYGGYLRTRTVGNTHYIDWVAQYGDVNAQPIEFSVNLLDLTDKADAGDVFTVLIPLGACELGEDGEYTDPLSIASVNNGLNYIQDDAAVALYGKIWRTKTWSYETDPAKLLEKGREYLKTGIALETLTLKAVDMHFVDGKVQPIRIGDRVRILSNPHGLDRIMVCSKIEIDLMSPENTLYTFGEAPRTLTENFVKAEEEVDELTGYRGGGGGRKSVKEEVSDIIRWAEIFKREQDAYIQLTAGEFNKINGNLSAVEIEMDGINAQISIAASRLDEVEDRTTSAEIRLDGAEAKINLHTSEITNLGNDISQAEIAIDGLEANILLKADKTTTTEIEKRVTQAEIDIDGQAAAIALKASQSTVDNLENRVSKSEAELIVQSDAISTKVSKDGVISSINQTAEEITISASKINLSGYVTASQLAAEISDVKFDFSSLVVTNTVEATSAIINSLMYKDEFCTWASKTVQTSIPSFNTATIPLENGNSIKVVTGWADAPSNFRSTIYYLSHT